MVFFRRLDRSAKRGAERPSLHDKPIIVERRSLHSALRASVETTKIIICDSPGLTGEEKGECETAWRGFVDGRAA
jgi:hypothetical protein